MVKKPIPENVSLISDLYKLKKEDIKKAANVLVSAYTEDPMLEIIFKDEDKRRIQFEVMLRFCMKYGDVYSTSNNFEGVMAIAPHDKDMTIWRTIRSGGFFLGMKIASVSKMMKQSIKLIEETKKNLNLNSYVYLFIIGVLQEFQGKGFGGKLLRAIIEKADIERKSMYLETQNEKNVSLYEKYGFYVVKKVNLPDPMNLPFWFMVRDAK
jgi:ribosomal protein S18 acetylase RimI-like enzyme